MALRIIQMIIATKNKTLIPPIITPAVAYGFPPNFSGDFLICERATRPSTNATTPGIGKKQPNMKIPRMPVIIDASANPWLFCWVLKGTYAGAGGGGGDHGPGLIGGRSSGAIQPPGSGVSRGSHCVSCSSCVLTFGSRIRGSQFGSAGGVNSWISGVPSSEQKLSHASSKRLLQRGQYFIRSNEF